MAENRIYAEVIPEGFEIKPSFKVSETIVSVSVYDRPEVFKHPAYMGVYTVTPVPFAQQELLTAKRTMEQNVIVEEIPYSEVSNEYGGTTVTIGE